MSKLSNFGRSLLKFKHIFFLLNCHPVLVVNDIFESLDGNRGRTSCHFSRDIIAKVDEQEQGQHGCRHSQQSCSEVLYIWVFPFLDCEQESRAQYFEHIMFQRMCSLSFPPRRCNCHGDHKCSHQCPDDGPLNHSKDPHVHPHVGSGPHWSCCKECYWIPEDW